VICVSGALLWVAQGETRHSLMETPPPILRSVTALDRMVDLPSGRHRIDVSADDLQALLARQSDLLPVLDEATREGWIDRAEMLLTHLPSRPEQPAAFPAVEAFAETLQGRLAEAGLSETFRERMVDAYREAREAPPAGPADLRPLLETLPVAGLISPTETGLSASVRLWGVEDPGRLAAAVDRLDAEGVSWTDEEARISAMLDTVSARLLRWFLAGAAVATVVLLAAFRSVSAVARIAGACLAGALATALAVTLVAGGLGLFQLVALALVVGLGIDYAIFVVRSEDDRQWFDAFRSILLCAATTLIAFIVMAFSGVAVLEDIGTTVVIGVSAMVVSALLLRPAPAQAGKR
jgi:predicted exporter